MTPTLHHELTFLRAQNARLKEENKSLIEMITKLSTPIILDAVLEANIPDDVLDGTAPDPYTTRGFMADEPKNWSEG